MNENEPAELYDASEFAERRFAADAEPLSGQEESGRAIYKNPLEFVDSGFQTKPRHAFPPEAEARFGVGEDFFRRAFSVGWCHEALPFLGPHLRTVGQAEKVIELMRESSVFDDIIKRKDRRFFSWLAECAIWIGSERLFGMYRVYFDKERELTQPGTVREAVPGKEQGAASGM